MSQWQEWDEARATLVLRGASVEELEKLSVSTKRALVMQLAAMQYNLDRLEQERDNWLAKASAHD